MMGTPVLGVVSGCESETTLLVYACATRRPIAVVRGSPSYVLLALVAIGLAPPVTPRGLRKHRDGTSITLVCDEPANGNAQCAR